MGKLPRVAAVAVALALTACGDDNPTSQGPAPVIDQAFEPGTPTSVVTVGSVGAYAQTFTAGITGTLTSVDLLLSTQGGDDTIRVDVRGTSGGNPNLDDAVVLGSRLIAATSLPAYPSTAFVAVNLASQAILVDSGQVLAIVLIRVAGTGPPDVVMRSESSLAEEYPNGTAMQRNGGSGTAWMSLTYDNFFRTRVLVP